MEVYSTEKFYIFVKKEKSLWWNRKTGESEIKNVWDLSSVDDIECIGITYGIIGEIKLSGVYEPHLLVIRDTQAVGVVHAPNLVYKIKSISILSQYEPDTALIPCSKHSTNSQRAAQTSPPSKSKLFDNQIMKMMKSAGTSIKNTTQQAVNVDRKTKVSAKDSQKNIERRINEELHKMFDDTDSFYYCLDGDITNNLQRQNNGNPDDRFFWNYHMLKEIMKLEDKSWVLPVIQGFVQVEECVISNECFTLALVSRRSRHRAGTRYKRRGIDENGDVANYVETEQILSLRQHQISFTQIRGSVPIFWSQPGYKYRPPPRIDRDDSETQTAFAKHFDKELDIYNSMCIINLVEQSGKEKTIFDKYGDHIIQYNNDKLVYVTFDFHYYCRGMRFENVSALVEALAPELGSCGFHWRDKTGPICNQKSIFRVNCIDCLDRTNVVQTALGKAVLESQLVKLGLAPPYSHLPEELKTPFMIVWANNGDTISRQYAGTNALKGDYTRTGERKISGLVKDGMNSASRYVIQHFADTFRQSIIDLMLGQLKDVNEFCEDDAVEQLKNIAQTTLVPTSRAPLEYFNYGVLGHDLKMIEDTIYFTSYYLARFKDTYRQATIDMMLGDHVSAESLSALGGQQGNQAQDEADALEGAEHARLLVEDCRRLLLGATQLPIGAWGLIDADPSSCDPNETEVDTILLLTNDEYIVAEYDSNLDKIVRYENVSLESVTMVEFGLSQHQQLFKGPAPAHLCIRINYAVNGVDGYFHMFRSPNIRFFNNVAVVIKKNEEIVESLSAIVELFRIALQTAGKPDVPFVCGGTLQRRKSRSTLQIPQGIPRNLSESQLVQIGSKALSNMAGQFSKFGKSLQNSGKGKQGCGQTAYNPSDKDMQDHPTTFYVGKEAKEKHDSESDSDDNDCSIYEPDLIESVEQNPIYNENAFLPSVGIVMSGKHPNEDDSPPAMLDVKDNMSQNMAKSDVSVMSISSVTDHINMPHGMLECASPIRSRSPAPEIRIQDENRQEATAYNENRGDRDLTLNLSHSQSDNALKQLKTLTSPLTKLAKGVQNLGVNLTNKTNVVQKNLDSPNNEAKHLEDKWKMHECKTKLIAL